jgi:hypothetical protein
LRCNVAQKEPEDNESPREDSKGNKPSQQTLSSIGIQVLVRLPFYVARPVRFDHLFSGGFPTVETTAADTATIRIVTNKPMKEVDLAGAMRWSNICAATFWASHVSGP